MKPAGPCRPPSDWKMRSDGGGFKPLPVREKCRVSGFTVPILRTMAAARQRGMAMERASVRAVPAPARGLLQKQIGSMIDATRYRFSLMPSQWDSLGGLRENVHER
ncbi:protein of unknown function (plasmid) [Azospirillum lipoferum 4B]|uniref:Uncharacterized protein n=1 Tax=Azospirillum lipoferum (strain 4B) TaxID=862719 RepID=G7ZEY3_AZOL4|nr:protein of unknown function [Azospirillum lipoferum 4B]